MVEVSVLDVEANREGAGMSSGAGGGAREGVALAMIDGGGDVKLEPPDGESAGDWPVRPVTRLCRPRDDSALLLQAGRDGCS